MPIMSSKHLKVSSTSGSSLQNKIDRLEGRQEEIVKEKTLDDGFWGDFPVQSLDHFDQVEDKFVDQVFSTKFIKMILSIGGRDCKTVINGILRKVMSDEVAVSFSYSGKPPKDARTPKRAFKQTIMCHKMHIALQKAFPDTEVNRKKYMALWFQQAKFRIMRRNKNTPEEMLDDDPFEI